MVLSALLLLDARANARRYGYLKQRLAEERHSTLRRRMNQNAADMAEWKATPQEDRKKMPKMRYTFNVAETGEHLRKSFGKVRALECSTCDVRCVRLNAALAPCDARVLPICKLTATTC